MIPIFPNISIFLKPNELLFLNNDFDGVSILASNNDLLATIREVRMTVVQNNITIWSRFILDDQKLSDK